VNGADGRRVVVQRQQFNRCGLLCVTRYIRGVLFARHSRQPKHPFTPLVLGGSTAKSRYRFRRNRYRVFHGTFSYRDTTMKECGILQNARPWLAALARGVHPGGVGGLDPLKICRRGQSMFSRHNTPYSFIQNCCWITLQVSRHRG